MSYLDLDKLSPVDLIVQYVLECRGAGLFLPYDDYQVIEEWLAASADPDGLLLVLADVLPDFFDPQAKSKPRSLSSCRRLVLSRLKDQAMRQPAR